MSDDSDVRPHSPRSVMLAQLSMNRTDRMVLPRAMKMTRRLVQITDCHLFADRERDLRDVVTWPRMVAILQQVRLQVPDADLLVLTGDTAHDAARETYRSVRELMKDRLGVE